MVYTDMMYTEREMLNLVTLARNLTKDHPRALLGFVYDNDGKIVGFKLQGVLVSG